MKSFILFAILFIAGCGSNTVFIVSRDVPVNPTLTVVPSGDYTEESVFANEIEETVIRLGLPVVTRPIFKAVVTKKDASAQAAAVAAQENSLQALAKSGSATTTESFFALDDTPAEYVLFTYSTNNRVKLIRKNTKEIILSFGVYIPNGSTPKYRIEKYDQELGAALRLAGFKLRPQPK